MAADGDTVRGMDARSGRIPHAPAVGLFSRGLAVRAAALVGLVLLFRNHRTIGKPRHYVVTPCAC